MAVKTDTVAERVRVVLRGLLGEGEYPDDEPLLKWIDDSLTLAELFAEIDEQFGVSLDVGTVVAGITVGMLIRAVENTVDRAGP